MTEKNRYDCRNIAMYHGYDAQSRQLIEEMAELTQAINKFWRNVLDEGKKNLSDVDFVTPEKEDIVSEIADVEVCLEHIKMFLDCRERVENVIDYKIARELENIEKKEKKHE